MPLPEGTVTILFTDVVASTALTSRRGDDAAHALLARQRQLVRDAVASHAGHEVKSIGDGFMVAFASARRAIACAVAIQRALHAQESAQSDSHVRVRIGLNTGEVIHDDADLFGSAVNAAARVADKAGGGQIFVSDTVRRVVGLSSEFEFIDRGRVRLKGFPERWRLYEVVWQAPADKARGRQEPSPELWAQRTGRAPARFPVGERAVIGRDPSCDVVLDSHFASRKHAQVVLQAGAYVLIDEGSRNGTLLNGKRVPRPARLDFGDEITIAEYTIFFRPGPSADATQIWDPSTMTPEKQADITLDVGAREVWVLGQKLDKRLSKQEFELLALLYARGGDVVPKNEMGAAVWGADNFDDNMLHRLLFRLKEKVERDPARAQLIVNVPGVGYKLLRTAAQIEPPKA